VEIKNIPNQIIKGTLTPLNLNKVDSIALHHMAHPTADVKEVEKWHIYNEGWSAIGYNFWVAFDGTIYQGRGFNLGAGVANQNSHIISIGFQGDYHSKPVNMPDAQFNSGIDIINYIKSKLPNLKKIGGHRDFMATACPGQYFPMTEMLKGVKRNVNKYSYDNTVEHMILDGITTVDNMVYWEKALDGREPLNKDYVRAILDRYHEKLNQSKRG